MKEKYLLDCPFYLKDYLTYIRVVCNYTEDTQNAYYCDLRIFLWYLKVIHSSADWSHFERLRIDDVPLSWLENFSLASAYEFMCYLHEKRHNTAATRFRRTSSLKRFYAYLYKLRIIPSNPILELEHPKVVKALPKFLTLDQSLKLLQSIDCKYQTRDFCIILLFLSCGMRLSELANLNIDDYSSSARTLRLFGKGQKERIIYLSDSCVKALDDYLAIRPCSDQEPRAIFLSNRGLRISIKRIADILSYHLDLAGLSNLGITVHKLRHTSATLMYDVGVDLLSLKEILGHKSLSSTEIYTHISDSTRRHAAEISPFAGVINKKM